MNNKYISCLIFILILTAGRQKSYAAFIIRANHYLTAETANNSLSEDDDAVNMSGHHGGGHHGGGHYHSHGGHAHHSYHYHGHVHHYSEHFHHYRNHYHFRHEGRVWWMDYAGASIFFDVLGLIPIGIFSIFGIAFGSMGRHGNRRGLATAGIIIGVLELLVFAALIVILLT